MQVAPPIKLGIILRPSTPYDHWKKLTPIIENAGFTSVWGSSTPTNLESYSSLTLAILNSHKIPVGLSLVNPFTRHPAITAVSAISMNILSQGRFILTYGAGTLEGLHAIGMDWENPLLAIREAIQLSKRIFAGGTVSFRGKTLYITDFHSNITKLQDTDIPIYLGGRGPKMLQLAGEIGDGVILDHPPLNILQYDIEQLEKGAKIGNRCLMPDEFPTSMVMPFCIAKKSEDAKNSVRKRVAVPFISITQREIEAAGLSFEDIKPIQDILATRTPNALIEAEKFVTDEMVDQFSIAGTPEECIERIIAYENAGINQILLGLQPSTLSESKQVIQLAKEEILSALGH